MVVRISGTTGITFGVEAFATESYVDGEIGAIPVKEKKIAAFTASGTWTVPTGVTYAIAHVLGAGGGGASQNAAGSDGGSSSVAFASGTITAGGGDGATEGTANGANLRQTVPANSGRGGGPNVGGDGNTGTGNVRAAQSGTNGTLIVAGAAVTPAASITVTVGLGGANGGSGQLGADGADGYVYIEYYEDAA